MFTGNPTFLRHQNKLFLGTVTEDLPGQNKDTNEHDEVQEEPEEGNQQQEEEEPKATVEEMRAARLTRFENP